MAAMDMTQGAITCDCSCDCCKNCDSCDTGTEVGTTASREVLLAELKKLLNDPTSNGRADRQTRIDEIIAGLDDLAEAD